MLVRDCEGRLIIISRKDCKNEAVYNEKLYNVRVGYVKKYKSVLLNPPPKDKYIPKEKTNIFVSKNCSDD